MRDGRNSIFKFTFVWQLMMQRVLSNEIMTPICSVDTFIRVSHCKTLSSHFFILESCYKKIPWSNYQHFEKFLAVNHNVHRQHRRTASQSSEWANFNQHGTSGRVRKLWAFISFINKSWFLSIIHAKCRSNKFAKWLKIPWLVESFFFYWFLP